ncbi:MFS transporter [Pseudofrankia sp. BMG5.36]|uniref:MFS transporter n=1 Tax=Pseudofrankia sp. BMG5.36 TaxID=1834512 RepID=UPI0008D92B00|nr:MFS transporter [Pseudofrankia sp. BMG5.36]OHV47336.1 hypothetical protein BCD48_18370 [Pseudofrankia sp. BMG5.36]
MIVQQASAPAYGASTAVVFGVLVLAALTYALQASMVSPALPQIGSELHLSPVGRSWIMTSFLLSSSVATPLLGRLGDACGRKRMLVCALAAFAVGSLIAALATSLSVMIVGRLVQGTAGAIFPIAFGIIRETFPREQVGSRIGVLSAMLGGGAGLGVTLAGPIVDHLGYQWLFWLPAGLIGVVTMAAVLAVPDSGVRADRRVSWFGGLLLASWLVALLLGASEGPRWGWTSPQVIALFVVTALLVAAWVATERRASNPVVDMRMLCHPTVLRTNVMALLFGFAVYSMVVINPQFVETPPSAGYGFGASVSEAGSYLLPSTLCILVASVVAADLAGRFGWKTVLVAGALIAALGPVVLLVNHDHSLLVYVATALFGTGVGLGFSSMSQLVVEAVPAEQTGVASGMNNNIRTIGGSIGTTVTAGIVAGGATSSGVPTEGGYVNAWTVMAIGFVVAAIVAGLAPRRPARALRIGAPGTSVPPAVARSVAAGGGARS